MTRKRAGENAIGYLFILPSTILLLSFVIYPLLAGIYNSFMSWNLITNAKFVGLRNYAELFTSDELWKSILNTFIYALIIIPTTLVFGFIFAFLIKKKSRVNVIYRTIYFIPRVTSMVAMSSVWLFLYNPQYGFFNNVLSIFGIPPVRWLNDPGTALPSVAVIIIWITVGYATVLFISGLQNIPASVIEAAELDGATGIRRIISIDLPLVSPTTFMLLILITIESLQIFTTIDVMTQGGPANSTQNLVVMLYRYAFQKYQIGYASAVSVILFVLILAVNMVQMRFEKEVVYD